MVRIYWVLATGEIICPGLICWRSVASFNRCLSSRESWLSAEMNPVGVFSTSEGEYIPYSKWSPFQSGETGNEICATSDRESWYIRKCDDEYNIVCFANIGLFHFICRCSNNILSLSYLLQVWTIYWTQMILTCRKCMRWVPKYHSRHSFVLCQYDCWLYLRWKLLPART